MRPFSVSSITIGRVSIAERVQIVRTSHDPAALRTRRTIEGLVPPVRLVLTTANMRPLPSVWSDFRFMWSSPLPLPGKTAETDPQAVSAAPSWCEAK